MPIETRSSIVKVLASRGNYDSDTEDLIRSMPKVELHVHLDGSFSPELIHRHLESRDNLDCLPVNAILPWDQSLWPVRALVSECKNAFEFTQLCTCRGKRSLYEMIKCFEIFTPLVRGNLELIEELSYDFCRRQAEQRVIYTECRYSPHFLAKGASLVDEGAECVDPVPVVDAVTRGLRRGSNDYGIIVNQILCCICWRPDWADSVVELAFERKNKGPCAIVGVDIAAGEEHFDSEKFPQFHLKHFEAMQKAQKLGLNITLHAGEVGSSDNIDAAVALYGAKRIGHGYHVVKNLKLMEELKAKRIHLETCPTSSRETGGWEFAGAVDWTHHPCVEMIENGLSVSFNSDDPAVFNTSLSWQYRTVVAKMNQQRETLISGVLAAIDAAFCSDKQKRYLRSLIEDYETGEAVTVGNVEFNDRVIDNMLLLAGESM